MQQSKLLNKGAHATIDSQLSSATLGAHGTGQRRAVSNPKSFMRARMAQQNQEQLQGTQVGRSKSRHANQTQTIEMQGQSQRGKT